MKDWTGNSKTTFATLGASSHAEHERAQHDYYATHPIAARLLVQMHDFNIDVWEPACGEGHISKELLAHGYNVDSTDLIDRGYGNGGVDFFDPLIEHWCGDIITNPPYSLAQAFITKAIEIIPVGNQVAMFLKLQFLETKGRKAFFKQYPPKIVYVSSNRIPCALNGDFDALKMGGGSAVAYAWYIWEKGYTGNTIIKWFN